MTTLGLAVPRVGRGPAVLRGPREIVFGPGASRSLGQVLRNLGGGRAFVCADAHMATSSEFRTVLDTARGHGIALQVYTDFNPELPLPDVETAIRAALGERPDVVVGWGGGSALDLAKLVALGVAAPGHTREYYGENRVPASVLPIVAVPTTAGTGSEVTPVAVVADPDRELKVGVSSPHLIPTVALVDPLLTHTCPPHLTASAGIDALAHAMESYTAREASSWPTDELPVFIGSNALSDLFSTRAVTLIAQNLAAAVESGHHAAPRSGMSSASLFAGMAFGTAGTHLGHAIQYSVGAVTHTPHGVGVGLLLPYVLEECLPYQQDRIAQLGRLMGSIAEDDQTAASEAIARTVELRRLVGIPDTLADIGVAENDLPRIVSLAETVERLVGNAPGPDPGALVERVVRRAWRRAA